jgi:hypothetical protein
MHTFTHTCMHAHAVSRTIAALKAQLPTSQKDPLYGQVMIVVLNNKPGHHKVFDDERRATVCMCVYVRVYVSMYVYDASGDQCRGFMNT